MNEISDNEVPENGGEFIEFVLEDDSKLSSSELVRTFQAVSEVEQETERTVPEAAAETEDKVIEAAVAKHSPVFMLLADPKLPELPKTNRAKLLMQSPNRLYFYWTVGENPFRTLNRAFGGHIENYTLVAKLIDIDRGTEEINVVDPDGSWWFDVDAGSEYRAEIGFYAVNRPFIRILRSNAVETPRKSPSPHPSSDSRWAVSADRFARVLDVSGFTRDAFDVALAGDEPHHSDAATQVAFKRFIGKPHVDTAGAGSEDIRFALLAFASGVKLEDLTGRIHSRILSILREFADNISSERALAALRSEFEFETEEFVEDEPATAVFGGSLVNMPRKLKKRLPFPDFKPVSSRHSLERI